MYSPRSLITALFLAALITGSATAQSARGVDLDFKGGSAADYVKLLLKQTDAINVTCSSGVDAVQVEPVQLRNADIASALYVIDGLRGQDGPNTVVLNVEELPRLGGQTAPVYRVQSHEIGRSRPQSLKAFVWSFREVTEAGIEAETILSAIEAALDMFDDSTVEPQLRYHADSRLLLVRAEVQQIEVIGDVIGSIERDAPAHAPGDLEKQLRKAKVTGDQQATELADLRTLIERLTFEVVQAKSQTDLLRRELDSAEARRQDSESRLLDITRERVIETTQFQQLIKSLRAKIQEMQPPNPALRPPTKADTNR